MKERQELVDKEEGMSIRKQCEVLSVNQRGLYYALVGESEENPEIMRKIDEHYLDHPTEGVIHV
jgi:putative transposase